MDLLPRDGPEEAITVLSLRPSHAVLEHDDLLVKGDVTEGEPRPNSNRRVRMIVTRDPSGRHSDRAYFSTEI